ncbi:efflux RND transporter permease subunit [Spiribacter halobius]|uniref:Multidrug transporter AcrB n=1 Tax=Sediminicurvatus halobius TaxID=2182432 RepID=A0A2U2N8F6_9GAMM|nr:efflux RND transporter permease subunit [Spiribacter halobius]PWG65471.1 multidrug transporter AcrB [Spiribacter halobius]UEX76494.1 efflux RND transporter permease subunit [Spiribacter halobius]
MRDPRGGLPALGIRRPVLVLVINLLIALAGVAALLAVEVRELPDVDRPRVTVTASYPGASPETMDAEVTRLIEGAVARVSGVRSISASSEENNTRIVIEFNPDEDLDQVAADAREAVSRVQRELPDQVEQVNVIKADDNASPVVRIAARSPTLGTDALTRVVEQDVIPELVSVPGVADISLFGERQRQLRVVVDPLRLASYGLAVNDIAEVLEDASLDVPAGSFRSDDLQLLVRADASTVTADQVEALEIRDAIRVGDVAHATFAPADASSFVRLNGGSIIGLGVIRQARSNTVEISAGIERVLERLNARLDDVELIKTSDDAIFIRGAIREVLITLGFSTLIVIAAIWLFIGSPRATLIPAVSIPLALIGTVAAIWMLGFSINLLTLLALVLATGLVVDDAIVVLENIQRRRSQGLAPRAAALLGTHQVFFAVVATTAVLISVFVPISLLPSTAGRLFREFGIVLAVAVALSSFVALSLVPAMAARVLARPRRRTALARGLARIGRGIAGGYEGSLALALRRPFLTLALGLLAAGGAALLFPQLERELLPPEDRGLLFISASGPDGAGLTYTERQANRMEAAVRPLLESGEVARLFTIVGRYDPNRALIVAPLAPWDERSRSQQAIAADLRAGLEGIPGAQIRVGSPNSLNLRGVGSGLEVALLGNDYETLYAAARELARRVETDLPNLSQPDISYQPTQPQLRLQVDRQRARELGIGLDGLARTLQAMIDGEELVDLNVADEAVPVFLESTTGEINDPGDLANLYVSTDAGALVPLSSVITLSEEGVAAELDREFQRRAITLDVAVAGDYPLQSAVDDLRALADEVLPDSVTMVPLGEAQTLQETSRDVTLTYGLALLVVLLVLCAQFESLTSALVVTLTVPFGVAAAVFALYLTGTSVNIYSQIGLILLIGLMAKNGILLVEFADQLRDRGASVTEAALGSARVRLRPVAMTMIATVLGGLPLILGSGPGAEARSAIGWVVFGGLGLAAVFTLYLTPVIYQGLARFSRPRASEAERLERELEAAALKGESG